MAEPAMSMDAQILAYFGKRQQTLASPWLAWPTRIPAAPLTIPARFASAASLTGACPRPTARSP
jgi:hypothetical protein